MGLMKSFSSHGFHFCGFELWPCSTVSLLCCWYKLFIFVTSYIFFFLHFILCCSAAKQTNAGSAMTTLSVRYSKWNVSPVEKVFLLFSFLAVLRFIRRCGEELWITSSDLPDLDSKYCFPPKTANPQAAGSVYKVIFIGFWGFDPWI